MIGLVAKTFLRVWQCRCLTAMLLVCFWAIAPTLALAAGTTGDLLKQEPIKVTVSLSNAANEFKFEPNQLQFVAGKRYTLQLVNPSTQKHYFTAKDFADNIWTQKVEAGKVEVKGAIREMELKPKAEAQWAFIAIKPGKYSLRCPIPGHAEAGMTGSIVITSSGE